MDATTYSPMFTRGNKADIPAVSDGLVRFAVDTEEIFIDYGNSRIQITDFVKGLDTTSILDTTSPLDKIYVASDTNQLWYYDTTESEWTNISINHTHAANQITGLGTLATQDTISIDDIDTSDGLDFGSEDTVNTEE